MANSMPGDMRSQTLRMGQIIVAALFAGLLTFGGVVIALGAGGDQPDDDMALVGMLMASFSLLLLIARFVVPAMLTSTANRKLASGQTQVHSTSGTAPQSGDSDEAFLAQFYLNRTIVASALVEAAAFCNLVAYMLNGQLYSLALGLLFAFGLWFSFPTLGGQEAWFQRVRRTAEETRDLARPDAISER